MKRKILIGLLCFVIVSGLIASAWIFLFGDSLFKTRSVNHETLSEIDSLLDSRKMADAEKSVLLLSKFAHNETDWRSLLARAYRISGFKGDYGFFALVAGKARTQLPANENLILITCKSLLLMKNYPGAFAVVSELRGNRLGEKLKAECAFRLLSSSLPDFTGFALRTRDFASLAARYTDDPAMFRNAALLSLRMGETDAAAAAQKRAFSLGGKIPIDEAEDAGAFALILEMAPSFPPLPLSDLAVCEALLSLGRFSEAKEQLKTFVLKYPYYSCKPFLNLAFLAGSDTAEREFYIDRAYQHFPRVKEAVLAEAEFLRLRSDFPEAYAVASGCPGWDEDPFLALSALRSEAARVSPEEARSKILYFLPKFPDNPVLEGVLAGELMRRGLWVDAFGALDRFLTRRKDSRDSEPFVYFSALKELGKNNYEAAIKLFESSGSEPYAFYPPFALGIVYSREPGNKSGNNGVPDTKKAYSWFSLAETKTAEAGLKSRCFKEMGKIRIRFGERAAAAALFLKAIQLDASDTELDSLLALATSKP